MESWRRKIFISDSQNECRGTKDPGYAIITNAISDLETSSLEGLLAICKAEDKVDDNGD